MSHLYNIYHNNAIDLVKKMTWDSRKYITGKGSSGLTRGVADTVLASGRAILVVALAALSFFDFLIEAPCFPPSIDLF
jgi:hypothetical protein